MTSPNVNHKRCTGCPADLSFNLATRNQNDLPDRFHVAQTRYGQRYESISNGQDLLLYVSGTCTNHHLAPESTQRRAIGKYIYGPTGLEEIHCSVMDRPTNQRAVLEAVIRGLERDFWREGFTRIIIVTPDKYLVDGMLRYYSSWEEEGWMKGDEERPNKRYWRRIKELSNNHRVNGCTLGVWHVTRNYLNSVNI